MRVVALRPHPASRSNAVRRLRARVARTPAGILVAFRLDAELARLRIPAGAARRFAHGLWRHTCFEIFAGGTRGYREYNLSPSGEWAGYAFSAYRKRARRRVPPPRSRVRRRDNVVIVSVQIPKAPRRLGLSAVIEEKGGALSYWALRHAPGRPDFHHPRAFALRLA